MKKFVKNLVKFVDKKREPYAEFWPQSKFTERHLTVMYALFEQYYDNTNFELFVRDFKKKTGAFVVLDPKTRSIVGFSTIMNSYIKADGKQYHAVFSGDTVVDKPYWGSRALPMAMYKYLIVQVLRTPTKPVYWMLISKGFKTYLLLANNFFVYYPHIGNKNGQLKKIVDAYCTEMFPDYYIPEKGIVDFGTDYQPLKGDVAPITQEMKDKTPNIAFFEKMNPEWERGTELACVAELRVADIYLYFAHWLKKTTSKGKLDAKLAKKAKVNNTIDIRDNNQVSERSAV